MHQLAGAGDADPPAARGHALARRHLLAPGSATDVGLAHPLFVEAVGRRLLPGEGSEVHARLAEALATDTAIEPAELADHWRAAGRPDREVSARVDAALAAGARFAFDTATMQEAVDLLEGTISGLEAR